MLSHSAPDAECSKETKPEPPNQASKPEPVGHLPFTAPPEVTPTNMPFSSGRVSWHPINKRLGGLDRVRTLQPCFSLWNTVSHFRMK